MQAVKKISAGNHLTRAEAESAMEEILDGRVEDARLIEFLTAMNAKSPAVDELDGFACAMRRHAAPIFSEEHPRPDGALVDTCGTGGDGAGTFNVSTAAAFVVAGAGVHVAKHGNRSVSSKCGSADVLEALGINVALAPARAGECIGRIGIGFLFAPAVHSAMKHAAHARKQMGVRTVFNLLGPLTNPAGATAQVLGVYDASLTSLLARALAELGTERAFVVHGAGGLDEISLSGETRVAEVLHGKVKEYFVTPKDFGMKPAPPEAIAGGDAAHNAEIIRKVLRGETGPRRNIVLINAAAALVASGAAIDFLDGVQLATRAIDDGSAQEKLDGLALFSNL
jgi:anthranilate phosphoribosyltransferase